MLLRLRQQHLALDPELGRRLREEVPGERHDVLGPLPEGRHPHPDHVEPVEEVLAEPPVPHPLPEVLVGGRDDAHLDPHRGVSTHPVELLVGQHPQQPRLEIGRHVPDLVEEQGAPVRLLEAPAVPGVRPGERASLVAEVSSRPS